MRSLCLALLLWISALPAFAALDAAVVRQLAAEDSDDKIVAIQKLGQSADVQALRLLKAMSEGNLFAAGDSLQFKEGDATYDATTGAATTAADNAESITINNRLRGEIAGALAALKLLIPIAAYASPRRRNSRWRRPANPTRRWRRCC